MNLYPRLILFEEIQVIHKMNIMSNSKTNSMKVNSGFLNQARQVIEVMA
jgi:hypothetical protein